jgi:hypothetical protein
MTRKQKVSKKIFAPCFVKSMEVEPIYTEGDIPMRKRKQGREEENGVAGNYFM